jgi:hypothetical protein
MKLDVLANVGACKSFLQCPIFEGAVDVQCGTTILNYGGVGHRRESIFKKLFVDLRVFMMFKRQLFRVTVFIRGDLSLGESGEWIR